MRPGCRCPPASRTGQVMRDDNATHTPAVLDTTLLCVSDASDKVLDRTHIRSRGRTVARPKPVGKLESPRVRTRLTLTPRTMPQIPPGTHEVAWVALATAVITELAPHRELTRKALPRRIETAVAVHSRDAYREGLLKRGL